MDRGRVMVIGLPWTARRGELLKALLTLDPAVVICDGCHGPGEAAQEFAQKRRLGLVLVPRPFVRREAARRIMEHYQNMIEKGRPTVIIGCSRDYATKATLRIAEACGLETRKLWEKLGS